VGDSNQRDLHDQHDLAEMAALEPRPDIRLVVTDMDGTLLDDDREIHDDFWPLADELFVRGITFCPASGRHYYSLRQKFAAIADEVIFIASNGAHVVARERNLHTDFVPRDIAIEVARRVRDVPDAHVVLVGARSAYIEDVDEAFGQWIRPHYPALAVVDDLASVADDVLSLGIFDRQIAEENSLLALDDLQSMVKLMATDPHWVDVVSPTADKGHAVRRVQELLGVTADQTMVFGDYLNDLEMMATGTYSFAMANAHPLLKERATWTAPTNSTNGVVRTIRTVIGLPVARS
jgi:Cof subfamily protein (haloacid dehalogenase superfamily)